jgi:hypothetical protein
VAFGNAGFNVPANHSSSRVGSDSTVVTCAVANADAPLGVSVASE